MYACGDVHAANVPLPAGVSRRHSNVEPGAVEVNVKDADVLLVSPDGPPVIVVSGAAVETVKLRVAADASVLPAASRARTLNVYVPSASGPTARGEVHATYVPTVAPGPSRRHSNVEFDSVLVNSNDGDALLIVPVGPAVIVVSGATVSTVNVRDAGVGSTLPTASIARTKNV